MNHDEAVGYLAGLIDGEGTVGNTTHPSGHRRHVSIANTDPEIIERALEACRILGIKASIYSRKGVASRPAHWADCQDVRITGRSDLERVAELPLCPRKADRLRALLDGYTLRYHRAGERPLDEVRSRYEAGGTVTEIANEFEVGRATAWRWLQEAGVRMRGRGGAARKEVVRSDGK